MSQRSLVGRRPQQATVTVFDAPLAWHGRPETGTMNVTLDLVE